MTAGCAFSVRYKCFEEVSLKKRIVVDLDINDFKRE